jgi:hypothetical protein
LELTLEDYKIKYTEDFKIKYTRISRASVLGVTPSFKAKIECIP